MNPTYFPHRLAELIAHRPDIPASQLVHLVIAALLSAPVQDTILDTLDDLLARHIPAPPPPTLPANLDAIAHLANIRAHLRQITTLSTTNPTHIAIPLNLWASLIEQASP